MRQRATEAEREAAIDAIMRERGYTCRDDAEWEYAEAHGERLGCIKDTPIETVEDLVDAYGEDGAAEILRHPIERARFGLPPLISADAPPPTART